MSVIVYCNNCDFTTTTWDKLDLHRNDKHHGKPIYHFYRDTTSIIKTISNIPNMLLKVKSNKSYVFYPTFDNEEEYFY